MSEFAREIFLDALERDGEERTSFVNARCGGDEALRLRVDELLRAHDRSQEVFGKNEAKVPTKGASGQRIGAFELQEVIGEGGFAVVWRATQQEPVRREVALKILKRGMDTAESVARFESERQALAMMDHPSIAKVLDGGTTEQRLPWFAMELVEGASVTEYCTQQRLNRKERLELFGEICLAVQHAHRRGVLHRDLKPSNVLVRSSDEGAAIKVIDFGIAKLIDEAGKLSSVQTVEGHWVGTPGYMSPEQLDELPDLDTRSDIYSLGVLLYELLCGTRPIDDDTLRSSSTAEVIRMIREVDPPKPSTRSGRRDLRGDLDWITMRCLEKDRDRRYDSVSALALDIRNHLEGAPVLAGPPHFSYRFSKFVRRYRIPIAVASALVALLLAGIISSLVQLRRARAAEAELQGQVERTETELAKFLGISEFYESVLLSVDPDFAQGMDTALMMRVLKSASLRVERESEGRGEVEATIRRVIGGAYLSLGQYEKAEPELSRAATLRRELLGMNNQNTLESLMEYGTALHSLGKGEQALPPLEEAYLGFAEILGPRSELTLRAHTNYAVALAGMRQFDQAETHLREIEAANLELHGEEHEDSIRAINNLASTLSNLGKKEEALLRYRRAAELQARVQGPTHPETLMAFNNLANLCADMGDLDEALASLEQVHQIKLQVLPEGHPSLLASYNNLASTRRQAGQREGAIALFQEGLEMATRAGVRNTPSSLILQVNLGPFLSGDGKIDDARALYEDAAKRATQSMGADHPTTLRIEGRLASFLVAKFSPDEAESLAKDVLKKVRKTLEAEDPEVAFHIFRYAEILVLQERFEEARPLLDEYLEHPGASSTPEIRAKAERYLEQVEQE